MNEILQKRIEEAANTTVKNLYDYAKQTRNPKVSAYSEGYLDAIDVQGDFLFREGANYALLNQWISVEEDLPPYDKAVIGMDYMPELDWDDQTIIFVHRSDNPNVVTDKNKFCVYPPTFRKVTHWMIIPSLEGGEK
jgi:hypothetical protein